METRALAMVWGFIIAIALLCNVANAEDITVAGFDKVYKVDGFYEYNKDGVPILGLITARMSNDRVKFTTCGARTLEVDVKQLKSSEAKCPNKKKDPGMWTWASNKIVPVVRTGSDVMLVESAGKNIDVSGLPAVYKQSISNAKIGEVVGYAVPGDDGKKSLWIMTPLNK